MATNMTKQPGLKFPGMSDEKYQVFREQLLQEDLKEKKFHKLASKIYPKWNNDTK